MLQSATDLGESGYDDKFGVGMVNALKALLSPWSTTVNDIDNANQLSSNSNYKIINTNSVPNNVNFSKPNPAPVSIKRKRIIWRRRFNFRSFTFRCHRVIIRFRSFNK